MTLTARWLCTLCLIYREGGGGGDVGEREWKAWRSLEDVRRFLFALVHEKDIGFGPNYKSATGAIVSCP